MKKMLIAALAVAGLVSCGSPNKYVIDGNIDGLTEQVYLFDMDGNKVDSTTAEKGVFKFKGVAETPEVYVLGTGENSEYPLVLTIFAEPGTIKVTGTTVTGTPTNDANLAYNKHVNELIDRMRDPATTPEQRVALDDEFSSITRKALEENQNNLFGAVLLTQQLIYEMSATEMLESVAKFPEALQQHELLKRVVVVAKDKQRTEVGQPYIEVVQNNAEGQPVSLKSVVENPKNKYVLVDFWASWCKPCMAEVPYLLEDYKTYHAKGFEIYGISFDTEKEKWTVTVKDNGMNWIHVSDLHRFDTQAAKDYAVTSIPSNFLVDCATGKIIAVNLRGEALGTKLAELLK